SFDFIFPRSLELPRNKEGEGKQNNELSD
ncbi:NUDIX hydrolase, partial [Acinetobacter baumannii]